MIKNMKIASKKSNLERANKIRFYLPIILFVFVASYETWEHILIEGKLFFNLHWTAEILFFGIFGPIAVYFVLTYVVNLLEKQVEVTSELEAFNLTLEQNVAERTEMLAERNAELAQANEELKVIDRMKSDFVSLVSHELRGPLTTLNGGLELALQNPDEIPPKSRRVLDVLAQESQRLTNFVQTILDVSRLDAGILSLNQGPVAVAPMLQRAIDLVFISGEREIIRDIPNNLPPIWVDENYFEKIVCNLLSNADKYSPGESPIELSVTAKDHHLEFNVTDYGPGISPEMQERVFERFQRLETGDSIESKGWGLGLYFAKALIEAQGGQIMLTSPAHTEGSSPGASFLLTVPIAAGAPKDG